MYDFKTVIINNNNNVNNNGIDKKYKHIHYETRFKEKKMYYNNTKSKQFYYMHTQRT